MRAVEDTVIEAPARRAPHVVLATMLLTLPLVFLQGPGNTTLLDAVNLLFLGVYWALVLVRRERVVFPLLGPFWLMILGGVLGLYACLDRSRAILTMATDVYLYVWFATLAHFLAHHCRIAAVVTTWVLVACGVALMTLADGFVGVFGGLFAGSARATGTFENPNMFSSYLLVACFLAWSAAAAGRRAFYVAVPILVAGLLSTASNGGFASLLAGTVAAVIARPAQRLLPRLGTLLLLAGLGIALLAVGYRPLRDAVLGRASEGRGAPGGAAMKGFGERFPLWLDAFYYVREVPTGIGPGNFNRAGGGPVSGSIHSAHNEYLGMLAERSVLGLTGWLGLLAGIFAAIDRLRGAFVAGYRPLATDQLYGLLGALAVHALVIEMVHFRHFWMVFALIIAAAMQARWYTGWETEPVVALRHRMLEESA